MKIDIVIPLYNEQEAVAIFHTQLFDVLNRLPHEFCVYYVNDGSTDETTDILLQLMKSSASIKLINLSRNFGHQAALTAGLDATEGDIIITMDGDGQHPAEMIPEMLRLAESGYDIVLMQQVQRNGNWFKNKASKGFYWAINRLSDTEIPQDVGDFRLMNREALNALKTLPEYHRFLRGIVHWIGYSVIILPYKVNKRIAGESKYTLRKMFKLAGDAIFSFSLYPLYFLNVLGISFFILAFIEIIYVLNFWVRGDINDLAPGWSSLMLMILIVGGVLMIGLGIIGIYIGYIFQEVKQRPVYLIKSVFTSEDKPQ